MNEKVDMYDWFVKTLKDINSPGCAQVVADTYNLPVCMYPDAGIKRQFNESITVLSLKVPVKPQIKNTHRMTVEFGHRRIKYSPVSHIYFRVDDLNAEMFKTISNLFGQLPKIIEGKHFDAETDELVVVKSLDEDE